MGVLRGYERISTSAQSVARQDVILEKLGVQKEHLYIDIMSGKSKDRPALVRLMEDIEPGDSVVVESISRFARNTRDLLELIEQLQSRSVNFVSHKEHIDLSTPAGRCVVTIFGAVAELEREYIVERTKEGVALAREQGKFRGGTKKQIKNYDAVVSRWQEGHITAKEAATLMGVSTNTLYRRVKETVQRDK